MKTLLIDNYDSFTFNLFQLIAEVNGKSPIVVNNDAADWEELSKLDFDNIVLSPGPGRPEIGKDFGVCRDAILNSEVPIFGVCLGHQGISHYLGGKVDYADKVMHGVPSDIFHTGEDIFIGIPSPFSAIRYHSLLVSELPDEMERLAWTSDEITMGVKHRERPIWGVQFHPESICSEYGHQILNNFRLITEEQRRRKPPKRRASDGAQPKLPADKYNIVVGGQDVFEGVQLREARLHGTAFNLFFRRVPIEVDAEWVYLKHYADSNPAFWLDSALVRGFSRFSYMGDASGPHAEFVSYDLSTEKVSVIYQGEEEVHDESIFSYLERMLEERALSVEGMPFDFNLGYAGYFGYELKAECGANKAHESPIADAAFVFADRIVAFDHEENVVYLVCIDDDENTARAHAWLDMMYKSLHDLPEPPVWSRTLHPKPVEQNLRHSEDEYLGLIAECKKEIKAGESYEICLTNMLSHKVKVDPLNTYRSLRHANPAPYATYLQFPECSVLSSSPERFLSIDPYGVVETKPIKGTRKRGKTIEEDEDLYKALRTTEKDRAENLMIVDLLRNDLGTVCDVGSVHVANIFSVESYASVHQLVSTVRGKLRRGVSPIECIKKAFPGGSMTGAPKKRTLEIIDRLEGGHRGVYSGAIGFIGLNGSVDLNIVIRTIVVTEEDVSVGVGGAIIDLSDPQDELEEMFLKSRAVVNALSETSIENNNGD